MQKTINFVFGAKSGLGVGASGFMQEAPTRERKAVSIFFELMRHPSCHAAPALLPIFSSTKYHRRHRPDRPLKRREGRNHGKQA